MMGVVEMLNIDGQGPLFLARINFIPRMDK